MTQRKGRRQWAVGAPRCTQQAQYALPTQKCQHETAADAQLDAVSKLRHSADSSSRLEAGRQGFLYCRSAEWLDSDTVSRQSQDREHRAAQL